MLPEPISQWGHFVKGGSNDPGRRRARTEDTEVTEEGKGDGGTGEMLGNLPALSMRISGEARTHGCGKVIKISRAWFISSSSYLTYPLTTVRIRVFTREMKIGTDPMQ
jgi:hypothetical protein